MPRSVRYVLDGVINAEFSEEVVQDHPICIERGTWVEALGLAPGKELLTSSPVMSRASDFGATCSSKRPRM